MSASPSTTKRDILLLLSVPLGLLALLAAIVYIPQALARPAHDFIYSLCSSYRCRDSVSVENGKIISDFEAHVTTLGDAEEFEQLLSERSRESLPQLYYYDVSNDASRPLTFSEAQRYTVDGSSRAPDGYTLIHESSSSGFLFWGSSSSEWVLKNGLYKKSVDIGESGRYYGGRDIIFIGWVQ